MYRIAERFANNVPKPSDDWSRTDWYGTIRGNPASSFKLAERLDDKLVIIRDARDALGKAYKIELSDDAVIAFTSIAEYFGAIIMKPEITLKWQDEM